MKRRFDPIIKRNIFLRGQATRVARLISELLESNEESLIKAIGNEIFRGPRRLEATLKAVYERTDALFNEVATNLKGELEKLAGVQAAWWIAELSLPKDTNIDASVILSQVLSNPFDGKLLNEWIDEQNTALKKRVRNVIRQGVVEGQPLRQIIGQIQDADAGVLRQNRRQTEAMVRTAVSHTFSTADHFVYKKANIKKYQFVSILDSRTTMICAANDGKIFELKEKGAKRPPLHVNCRSFTIPVQDDSDIMEENYETWLTRQSVEDQQKILGKSRWKLWQGGEPLGSFVDINDHVIPLEDL